MVVCIFTDTQKSSLCRSGSTRRQGVQTQSAAVYSMQDLKALRKLKQRREGLSIPTSASSWELQGRSAWLCKYSVRLLSRPASESLV